MMGVGVEMAKKLRGQHNDPDDTLFLTLTGEEVMLVTLGLSFVNAFGEIDCNDLSDKISKAIEEQKENCSPIQLDEMRVETINLKDLNNFNIDEFLEGLHNIEDEETDEE